MVGLSMIKGQRGAFLSGMRLDPVMFGLGLTTVLTTMWAIFGSIWRTSDLYGNADLAYLWGFPGQGGIPRHI
jgi:hypothetical protein